MTQNAEVVSAQALRLAPSDRLTLVDRLLDSLDEPDPSLDALWTKEAADRLAAYRRGDVRALALSDVIAKYQATHQSS